MASAEGSYLDRLYRKALSFNDSASMNQATYLYRNKTLEYFEDIASAGNVMEPYKKDKGGDPRNPINDTSDVLGLFFCCNVMNGGGLPGTSPFGPRRISVLVSYLKSAMTMGFNLYFNDFYCMGFIHGKRNHYVTIVMTEVGSQADVICRGCLIPLPTDNPFITFSDEAHFMVSSRTWVEVLYTKCVDISDALENGARMDDVNSTGTSSGGIPKDPTCVICNVQADDDEGDELTTGFEELSLT